MTALQRLNRANRQSLALIGREANLRAEAAGKTGVGRAHRLAEKAKAAAPAPATAQAGLASRKDAASERRSDLAGAPRWLAAHEATRRAEDARRRAARKAARLERMAERREAQAARKAAKAKRRAAQRAAVAASMKLQCPCALGSRAVDGAAYVHVNAYAAYVILGHARRSRRSMSVIRRLNGLTTLFFWGPKAGQRMARSLRHAKTFQL